MSVEVNNESSMEADLEAVAALGRHVLGSLYVHPED